MYDSFAVFVDIFLLDNSLCLVCVLIDEDQVTFNDSRPKALPALASCHIPDQGLVSMYIHEAQIALNVLQRTKIIVALSSLG